jgi:uncharacterized repeat protein (TIGR03803 family)
MRNPQEKLIECMQSLCILCALCAAIATIAPAQTVIHRFSGTNGEDPWPAPFEGFDTALYGTTSAGGAYQNGTIYKLGPEGKQIWVYSFWATSGCPDGSSPLAGITLGFDGLLYGTTWLGGAYSGGTVFTIHTNGTQLVTLHSFCQLTNCDDGTQPTNTMVSANNGAGFEYTFGTTAYGGGSGNGTIFVAAKNYWDRLYNFCSLPNCADGQFPEGPLIQSSDPSGSLYGTTQNGGAYGFGTVFAFYAPALGDLTTIYSFCQSSGCPDGGQPSSGVIQGADGNFYGVALHGVTSTGAAGDGVVFQLTPQGVLNVLHTFSGEDGNGPTGLIQATDGNLYGMTETGGAHNRGTIFEVTTGGTFTKLYDFANYGQPHGGLMQKTDGNLYGAASVGGSTSELVAHGVIFRYDTGLSPFVKLLPVVGSDNDLTKTFIYGPNLTGATAVLFNGVPSTDFDVVSSTLIRSSVPVGATTGPVTVVTPSGTLTSNVAFSILGP